MTAHPVPPFWPGTIMNSFEHSSPCRGSSHGMYKNTHPWCVHIVLFCNRHIRIIYQNATSQSDFTDSKHSCWRAQCITKARDLSWPFPFLDFALLDLISATSTKADLPMTVTLPLRSSSSSSGGKKRQIGFNWLLISPDWLTLLGSFWCGIITGMCLLSVYWAIIMPGPLHLSRNLTFWSKIGKVSNLHNSFNFNLNAKGWIRFFCLVGNCRSAKGLVKASRIRWLRSLTASSCWNLETTAVQNDLWMFSSRTSIASPSLITKFSFLCSDSPLWVCDSKLSKNIWRYDIVEVRKQLLCNPFYSEILRNLLCCKIYSWRLSIHNQTIRLREQLDKALETVYGVLLGEIFSEHFRYLWSKQFFIYVCTGKFESR